MKVRIAPKKLNGNLDIMPSKSHGHRLIIAQYLSGERTTIPSFSEDILATKNSLEALKDDAPLLPCKESGSTLRFLLPVAAALKNHASFNMEGRLPSRPLSPLKEEMERHGVAFTKKYNLLTINGKMSGGTFNLAGNISSQFITGLLFALPLTEKGGEVKLTSPLESKGYVDLTCQVLKDFNIDLVESIDGYTIKGNQKYISSQPINVEGDWSNGAFFIVAKSLGSNLNITGLNDESKQPDVSILKLINEKVIDASQVPDLVPILAVNAALTNGVTEIKNAARLRIKESDRLKAMATNLQTLGIKVIEKRDGLIIHGGVIKGGTVSSFNDHRVAMAMAVAATCSQKHIIIEDAQAVSKSYPDFFKDFAKLGGDVVEI